MWLLLESWQSSCTGCGLRERTSVSVRYQPRRLHKARLGAAICSAEDVGSGQSVSIPVRCFAPARAVSLDDLASPDPIMERAARTTPDRSVGPVEQRWQRPSRGRAKTPALRLRSQAHACTRSHNLFHRYLGSLQLFASEKTAGSRSFPQILLPARRGCRLKCSFRSAK